MVKETDLKLDRDSDIDIKLIIRGYEADGNEANLCCSECGERVEFVREDNSAKGAVCGCRDTPKQWIAEEI